MELSLPDGHVMELSLPLGSICRVWLGEQSKQEKKGNRQEERKMIKGVSIHTAQLTT
jgi:hypothetical protein